MKALRLALPLALVSTLAACSGSGGGLGGLSPIFGGNSPGLQCQTGTSVQLANPLPLQNNASNVNQITIVANGSSNQLYSSYQNWYVFVVDSFGQQVTGNNLSLVPYPNGPHPYSSDFYYASQLPQTLQGGQTYTAYLARYDESCSPVPLQTFSTQ
jgi:hypothetical protein